MAKMSFKAVALCLFCLLGTKETPKGLSPNKLNSYLISLSENLLSLAFIYISPFFSYCNVILLVKK